MEVDKSKSDQLVALMQNFNAISDAIRVSADKLIELGVIDQYDIMSKTISNLQNATSNIEEVRDLISKHFQKQY